jgi:hypothetical protein
MPIFAVMGLKNQTALAAKIEEEFPEDHYTLDSDKWFVVAGNGTTSVAVAAKLGLAKGVDNPWGVVVTVGGYNGFASTDLWEWLKAKGTQAGG